MAQLTHTVFMFSHVSQKPLIIGQRKQAATEELLVSPDGKKRKKINKLKQSIVGFCICISPSCTVSAVRCKYDCSIALIIMIGCILLRYRSGIRGYMKSVVLDVLKRYLQVEMQFQQGN